MLRQIQDAALDSSVPLADTLRRCKVLAAGLQSEELAAWVGHELCRYANAIDQAPEYRRFNCQSFGSFSGLFGAVMKNVPIPPSLVPKEVRHFAERATIVEPVAGLEAIVASDATVHEGIRLPWPTNLARLMQSKVYQDMSLLSADRVLSRAQVVGILDTVRTRVLEFALEVEKQDPDAGEASLQGQPPVPEEQLERIVNVTIYGGQQAFGDRASFQAAGRDLAISSVFSPEQREQLTALLAEMHQQLAGVTDEADREDATEALQKVETELAKAEPKASRIRGWLGAYAKFVPAAAGTVKLVESIAELLN